MNRHSIKIGNAPRGSRNAAPAAPPAPTTPVLSVDLNSMTFNIAWNGTPVHHWEIFLCENPPGPFADNGGLPSQSFPTDYWNVIGDLNVDWALYVVGRNAAGTDITPQSNVLTGHSPSHY